jgi:hypothetical protein
MGTLSKSVEVIGEYLTEVCIHFSSLFKGLTLLLYRRYLRCIQHERPTPLASRQMLGQIVNMEFSVAIVDTVGARSAGGRPRPNTFRRLRNPFKLDSLAVCGAFWSAMSRDKLEVGRPRGFSNSITPHNKHKSTSNQLAVLPSMFCCQHVEHTEIDSNDDSRSPTQRPSTYVLIAALQGGLRFEMVKSG